MPKRIMFVDPDTEMGAEIAKLMAEGHSSQTVAAILDIDPGNLRKALKEIGYQFYSGYFKPGEMTKTIKREGVKSFSLGITVAYLKEDKTND